jgi:hypothetical protein
MPRLPIPKPDPDYIPVDWQAECDAEEERWVRQGEHVAAHPGNVEPTSPALPASDTAFVFTIGLVLGFVAGVLLMLVCFAWR